MDEKEFIIFWSYLGKTKIKAHDRDEAFQKAMSEKNILDEDATYGINFIKEVGIIMEYHERESLKEFFKKSNHPLAKYMKKIES